MRYYDDTAPTSGRTCAALFLIGKGGSGRQRVRRQVGGKQNVAFDFRQDVLACLMSRPSVLQLCKTGRSLAAARRQRQFVIPTQQNHKWSVKIGHVTRIVQSFMAAGLQLKSSAALPPPPPPPPTTRKSFLFVPACSSVNPSGR